MSKISTEERKLRTKELRIKHQPLLNSLNIPDALFIPKMAFNEPSMSNQLVMGFFESELLACTDIYTEMVSSQCVPEDSSRTLYKYRANPHFRSEYLNKPTSSGNDRYLVPMSELIEVKAGNTNGTSKSRVVNKVVNPSTTQDIPMSEMTLRDFATLTLGKPLSDKDWVNNLVSTKTPVKKSPTTSKKPSRIMDI